MAQTPPRKQTSKCAVLNCKEIRRLKTSTADEQECSFFTFPKEPERCKKWILNIGRLDLLDQNGCVDQKRVTYCVVCSKHFDLFANYQRNRLYPTAIPVFNLPPISLLPNAENVGVVYLIPSLLPLQEFRF